MKSYGRYERSNVDRDWKIVVYHDYVPDNKQSGGKSYSEVTEPFELSDEYFDDHKNPFFGKIQKDFPKPIEKITNE